MPEPQNEIPFIEFPKLTRVSRECVITEKLDGTNAQLLILERSEVTSEYVNRHADPIIEVTADGRDYIFLPGSRNRWISKEADNYGFARWVYDNAVELLKLGPGRHFGEWWGNGIQRRYGLKEKRWSLFNTARWTEDTRPACCSTVPVLYQGIFTTEAIEQALEMLREKGSVAAPGFMNPEGIVCFHLAGNFGFKKTLDNDAIPKSLQ